MTSLIILAASALAILGLIGLNAWLGGWTPSRIDSLEAAIAQLEHDFLRLKPGESCLTADHRAVFVEDAGSPRTGLVVAQGDILVSRLLTPDDVAHAEARDNELRLRLKDFTFPAARIDMGAADLAERWARRLRGEG